MRIFVTSEQCLVKTVRSIDNGQKKTEENFTDGKRNGSFTLWDENGQQKLVEIYKNDVISHNTKETYDNSYGKVDYSLISTLKSSWQSEGWKYKPKSEQAKAIAVMIAVVRSDVKSAEDVNATLNYIEANIQDW